MPQSRPALGSAILCVGALTMDTIYRMTKLPDGPGKFLPLDAVEVAEGMAASAAASIARLGGRVALWTSVGDDAVGERLLAAMAAEGVDCSPVRPVAGVPSAVAAVLVDATGERMIVPFYHPFLWHGPVLPAGVAAGQYGAVLVDVRWPDAAAMALTTARQVGAYGVLDADIGLLATLARLAPLASYIVASRPGAAILSGVHDAEKAARQLARRFDAMIVVTAGEEGSFWAQAGSDDIHHTPAFKIEAIDTTAAGDVFHGAFALGLVEGMEGEELVRFAAAAAAVKCTRFGGRLGAPTRLETEALLKGSPKPSA